MKPQAAESKGWDPMWLPIFLASAASVPAGALFESWLPQPMANGVGFFLAWLVAGVAISFVTPIPRWSLWRWALCSAVGGILGGTLTFLIQE